MDSKQIALETLQAQKEFTWLNPNKQAFSLAMSSLKESLPSLKDLEEAHKRFQRFEPVIGQIHSPLKAISTFKEEIALYLGGQILGEWLIKRDDVLPLAGSVKARGGFYEVIELAEKIALDAQLIDPKKSYDQFLTKPFHDCFNQYTLVVASTGNLGLSIGMLGRKLGFKVCVHMSSDAKPWKIDTLKTKGAEVILHDENYSHAIEKARKSAEGSSFHHFVDDEQSRALFIGYAVSAFEIQKQLHEMNKKADDENPLFVYLPCGVGGAPGGIAYGLKLLFQDHVYIFFAEPVESPCMLLGMATERYQQISTDDIMLSGKTLADGLAVQRSSAFVGQGMKHLLDGIYTVHDEKLLKLLFLMNIHESVKVEPSAVSSLMGPIKLFYDSNGFQTLIDNQLLEKMQNATHISWLTGGSLMPEPDYTELFNQGKSSTLTTL